MFSMFSIFSNLSQSLFPPTTVPCCRPIHSGHPSSYGMSLSPVQTQQRLETTSCCGKKSLVPIEKQGGHCCGTPKMPVGAEKPMDLDDLIKSDYAQYLSMVGKIGSSNEESSSHKVMNGTVQIVALTGGVTCSAVIGSASQAALGITALLFPKSMPAVVTCLGPYAAPEAGHNTAICLSVWTLPPALAAHCGVPGCSSEVNQGDAVKTPQGDKFRNLTNIGINAARIKCLLILYGSIQSGRTTSKQVIDDISTLFQEQNDRLPEDTEENTKKHFNQFTKSNPNWREFDNDQLLQKFHESFPDKNYVPGESYSCVVMVKGESNQPQVSIDGLLTVEETDKELVIQRQRLSIITCKQ